MTKLVKAINIKSKIELTRLLARTKREDMKTAVFEVVFEGRSYVDAGKPHGISSQHIRITLLTIYKRKFGKDYNRKRRGVNTIGKTN